MSFYGSGEDPVVRNDRSALVLIPLTLVLVAALVVFYVLFTTTTVAGESMEPNLLPADKLLLTRGYPKPARSDIVVFDLVEQGATVEVVKRVIAIPGDEVRTVGGSAWVNGAPEPDRGLDKGDGASGPVVGPLKVPPGQLFVMGDNRPVSLDSRYIGFVPLSSVHGRAVAIFAPVTRLRRLD